MEATSTSLSSMLELSFNLSKVGKMTPALREAKKRQAGRGTSR